MHEGAQGRIRVYLIDDHAIVRDCIAGAIADELDMMSEAQVLRLLAAR
jgi:DNA-binding NarL/FixJ family response regulator